MNRLLPQKRATTEAKSGAQQTRDYRRNLYKRPTLHETVKLKDAIQKAEIRELERQEREIDHAAREIYREKETEKKET